MTEPPIDAQHEMKRGLWWMGAATLAMRLLDVGAQLLILQFLSREAMGLATLAWSVSVLLEAFNGLGIGQYIVRQRELGRVELSGLFWFATLLGVVAVAVMYFVAPLIARFYDAPELAPMIVACSVKLIFVGAALVPLQLLTRDLQFKRSGAAQTLASLGEAVTKVTLVALGFGAWGLVLANVARGLYLLLALWWLAPFRPQLTLAVQSTVRAVRFGLRVAASQILYHSYRNMDYLLIGKFLGKEAVGVYRVAFDLGMTPLEIILQLVNRVQFPIYARLRDHPRELAEAFYRSARSLLLLLGPIAALICFASGDVLQLVGRGEWLAAVPMIQVLCWGSLLRGMSQLFPSLYNASGRPQYAVYDSALTGGTLVGGFFLALTLAPPGAGALWVAWVWLLTYPIALTAHFFMARRCAPVTPGGMMATLLKPALGLALVSAVLGAGSFLRGTLGSPVLSLAVLLLLGLGTHLLYLHRVMHVRLGEILPRRAA